MATQPPVDGKIGTRDRSVPWFDETVTIPPAARELFENYSHIPPEEVQDRVVALRNKAWEVWPYPCLGQFRFVELNLAAREDLYPRLLDRLKAGDRFLDVGCCLGQDIRKLVYDGVPGENLVGAELNAGFIDVGYELFGDRDTLRAQFVVANVLEEDAPVWKDLHSQFDVVQLGMILHLFSWEEQVKVFEHAIKLLKPGKKGVSIIGQAVGHLLSEAHPANRKNTFRHNAESFKRLIDQVSTKTGTQWKVEASVDEGLSIYDGKRTWDDPNTRRLLFEVERV